MQDFKNFKQPLTTAPNRLGLIRDIGVFQLKLAIDAMRDLLISPISIVAGLVDLITGGKNPGRHFYSVLIAGHLSEKWINLFGQEDRAVPETPVMTNRDSVTVDAIIDRIEKLVVEQYENGGLTSSAKSAMERSIERISRRRTS
jgi:hypothetical protein